MAAAAAVGAAHAGVDLIEDEDGSLLVLEVNSMPAWQGLQSVSRGRHRGRVWRGHLAGCLRRPTS